MQDIHRTIHASTGTNFVPITSACDLSSERLYQEALCLFSHHIDAHAHMESAESHVESATPALALGEWADHRAIFSPHVYAQESPHSYFPHQNHRIWWGGLPYPDEILHTDTPHTRTTLNSSLLPPWGGYAEQSYWLDIHGQWWRHGPVHPDIDSLLPQLRAQNLNGEKLSTTGITSTPIPLTWDYPSQKDHHNAVHACLEAIRAGEVYQACISGRFHSSITHPLPAYLLAARYFVDILSSHPARHAFFLSGEYQNHPYAVASISPETFLSRQGEHCHESPIKGTIPLSERPHTLLSSTKDIAENIMIVDLVRHDLSHHARTGSIRVPSLLEIKQAPGVWHLVSTVSAEIPLSIPHAQLIQDAFPPASVTGTPKIAARRYLQQWEKETRQFFCGALGFSLGSVLDTNVAIRTAEFSSSTQHSPLTTIELGVGGGITIDSTPEGEWQEILSKATVLLPESIGNPSPFA